ncbi:uncharacterized hydrophobic domain-containing protein [Algoriella xinjiangensis]|uniref:Uncharacterized hydrophobic domain-containing protein n=1 Tax=Algoriella xinjiangensis TaxID=684065 RepID=A0A1I4S9K2_9FLAO|nr:DUF389 domain-containing protein [Algoriella xinjiangensis]SFM61168.1 uncharacterized hydrophobic domain-containing protein [Algoriella xinjiangensis]VDH15969.1 uncharacterized hydrophobic domain [Algoriella xinjiangensis]
MSRLKTLLNLHTGEEDKTKVLADVVKNISFRGSNLWILACAIFIASIGLNVNSTAVIIGAMLISPLMGPIVGAGFALATYDFNLLKKSAKNLLIATVVSLIVSSIYFYLSPFKEVQSELLARTSPTIYDVLIAFFGGIVGAISITRVEKGNPIPGVAIATALMPPLCTAGFGLAALDFKFFIGAMYLYCINCFFIGIATFAIIKYLKFKPVVTENKSFDKKLRYIITILVFLMVIPSFYLAYNLLNEKKFSQNVNNYIKTEFTDKGYTLIYQKISYNASPKTIDLAFLTKKFDSIEIDKLNKDLIVYGLNNTKVNIRQSTQDMKSEILSELSKQNTNLSEKDIQINLLSTELKQYKFDDPELVQEVKVLFPEITEISFGKINNYFSKDSTFQSTVVIYKVDKKIDAPKLMQWLQLKFSDNNVQLIAN